MKYTVVWLPRAQAALANLWMHAPDQQEVAEASNRLDAALGDEPDKKGRPFGKFFVQEDAPLAIMYHVDAADRMVRVITAKRVN
jgi:hypothetical protein